MLCDFYVLNVIISTMWEKHPTSQSADNFMKYLSCPYNASIHGYFESTWNKVKTFNILSGVKNNAPGNS